MTARSKVVDPDGVPQRIVEPSEALRRPWVPTRPELLETVATEPDRTRAAVVEALRNIENKRHWAEVRERADAIENGADW